MFVNIHPWMYSALTIANLYGCQCIVCREAAMKRTMERRESPPKELPTKYMKHRRMKERGDLAATLGFDEEHADKCSKRCAGTQTPYSAFPMDPAAAAYAHYQKQREEQSGYVPSSDIVDLDRMRHQASASPGHSHLSPHPHGGSPHPHLPGRSHEQDSSNGPLNLTVSSGGHQFRPSVITCAANGGRPMGNGLEGPSGEFRPTRREVTQVEVSDPIIDEHFRRSLGKDYPDYLARNPQLPCSSSSPTSSSFNKLPSSLQSHDRSHDRSADRQHATPVSVTGTVDDHFAKSLGSAWTKIKAQQEPAASDTTGGSVDDHFAKALGDTWYKIKAQKEASSGSNSPMSTSPSPPHRRSPDSGGQA